MGRVLDNVLSEDPERLTGEDLLLYNLAYSIQQADVNWSLENINFFCSAARDCCEDLEDWGDE